MRKLIDVEREFQSQLVDLKYRKAIALLELISDEDYLKLQEDNEKIFAPILEENGEEYLHNDNVLDQMIAIFTECIKRSENSLDKMNASELYMYITKNIENLDTERLRGIAKVIKNMLGI